MSETYHNFIDGKWVPARSGKTFENRNPANQDELVGNFPDSDESDVNAAVAAARRGYESWRLVPAPRRAEIVRRAASLLEERKEDLARLMTREMGKVLAETRGDVQEAIDCGYFASGEGRRLYGDTAPSEMPNKAAYSVRMPVGVCAMITPWNFPMAIPSWKIFPALVCGNSVVFKPATDTPASAAKFVQVLAEAGIPDGVVNFLTGGGRSVGGPLAAHPDVRVVSFTGSSEVGRVLARECGTRLKRLSLELGGKNAQIVMEDANLDLALEGVLWGAFGTTGQRCTATSRLIVHRKVHDKFLQRLADAAAKLKLGDGRVEKTDVGPLIHEASREKVERYVDIGRKEGAELVAGGKRPSGERVGKGYFYQPTVFAGVKPRTRLEQEEIFGPVLSVIQVGSFDEAVQVNNDVRYGLSSSIYTGDVTLAFRAMQELDNGITYVNAPTIGAEAHLPFGGVKATGNGHREGGWEVFEFYSETKVCYVDYSGKLQRAQIDTYDV
jgi:aldehyde dehydrogenase (NAD+)